MPHPGAADRTPPVPRSTQGRRAPCENAKHRRAASIPQDTVVSDPARDLLGVQPLEQGENVATARSQQVPSGGDRQRPVLGEMFAKPADSVVVRGAGEGGVIVDAYNPPIDDQVLEERRRQPVASEKI